MRDYAYYVAASILGIGILFGAAVGAGGMYVSVHHSEPSIDSVRNDLCRVPYQDLVAKSQNDPNLAGVVIALCVPVPRAQTASVPSDTPAPAKPSQEPVK